MGKSSKTAQLQIRISATEKAMIHRAAARAGLDMSAYVLRRVLSEPATRFRECVEALAGSDHPFALAEINSLLTAFTAAELHAAIAASPQVSLTPFLANYVAAMVEYACAKRAIVLPAWTRAIPPLVEPVFGTNLKSLRLHLLTHSPAPFRQRNIFVDATLGDRV
jgi:hypothetical protein